MDITNPLLLTFNLAPDAQLLFNALRKQHFPVERNFLDAHIMLFHHLPANEKSIVEDIKDIVKEYQNLTLQVTALSSIGNGVAYKIESNDLQHLHKQLQTQWAQWLIPQDKINYGRTLLYRTRLAPRKLNNYCKNFPSILNLSGYRRPALAFGSTKAGHGVL